eukprot:CAMPEP_0171327026 /NCGR_PEP_ID=MMETSP0816-20121228/117820_1 /TAXON_ID=420281 /ORGANISM="Proboscia inermis, Strain CCAP1064/1" /LENGTH=583 /DNA_ID=CAMNT_0011826645 /DNA_START=88 /DNA_END=1840 /DNA_ORIENTATION=+
MPIQYLQQQHTPQTPVEALRTLANEAEKLGIDAFDVYGDFGVENVKDSYLRGFEREVSEALGMEEGVFMPSGVMAQNIALLIHSRRSKSTSTAHTNANLGGMSMFACHDTSHLLLHEEDAYRELLLMNPLVIPSHVSGDESLPFRPPMRFNDVQTAFESHRTQTQQTELGVSTLILELPHRELGGKLTPWQEVLEIGTLCRTEGVKFHCDGARIFEASAGYHKSLPEVTEPFDSVYISFYKGIGALSGAMLLGDAQFCSEARTWLRRFGGNLYTLLPYAVSAWAGYRHKLGVDRGADNIASSDECERPTFRDKQEKMIRLVAMLSNENPIVPNTLSFDPPVPQTCMVHGYLTSSLVDCETSRDEVLKELGISVLSRMRSIETDEKVDHGFRTKFEWAIGDGNYHIDDEVFLNGWSAFANKFNPWIEKKGHTAVSAWAGYRHKSGIDRLPPDNNNSASSGGCERPTFRDKQEKMIRLVAMLSNEHLTIVPNTLSFDPPVPQTCMVHGYLTSSLDDCETARDEVVNELGISVLSRMRSMDTETDPVDHGFRTKFEWAIGDGNYHIDDEVFLNGWKAFANKLQSMD